MAATGLDITTAGIALGVISLIVCALIIVGNLCTIIAVARTKILQTLTNAFVVHLAIADIIIGISSSNYAMGFLVPNIGDTSNLNIRYVCFWRFASFSMSMVLGVTSLTSIAIERYIYFNHPLHFPIWMTKKTARRILFILWLYSSLVGSMVYVFSDWSTNMCSVYYVIKFKLRVFWVCNLFVCMAVMATLYCLIFNTIRRHQRQIKDSIHAATGAGNLTRDRKGIKMLLMVFGAFIACWGPVAVVLLVDVFTETGFNVWSGACFILSAFNSCINCLIYAWRSKPFRSAYKNMCIR